MAPQRQRSRTGHSGTTCRVLIVDQQLLLAESLQVALPLLDSSVQVVGVAQTAEAARHLLSSSRPQVIVIDSELAETSGLLAEWTSRHISGIVIVASNANEEAVLNSVEAGAHGFVLKTAPLAELISVISHAAAGKVAIHAQVLYEAVQRNRRSPPQRHAAGRLTPREEEVLDLIGQGLDNRTIAARLRISVATARSHVQRVIEKLGVHSKLEAMKHLRETKR